MSAAILQLVMSIVSRMGAIAYHVVKSDLQKFMNTFMSVDTAPING
jgi:hypothetical protein